MYLPVKVMDRKWADQLMQGHVYMRALEEFGGWRIIEKGTSDEEALNNDFRGDIKEGFVRNLKPGEPDPFFDGFSQEFKDLVKQRGYIDDTERETRIFSMARLEYDADKRQYKKLSAKFSQFGDTAVVIIDPQEFYRRIESFYHREYENNFIIEVGEVRYKDPCRDFGEWGIFSKTEKYNWQSEIRIAARLRPDIQKLCQNKPQPIIADIGDIRDLAIELPLQELLNGRWCSELSEDEVIARLEQCKVPENGLTDETLIIAGNFKDIGPYNQWIEFWRDSLKLNDWVALTRMESISDGVLQMPRLEFREKNCGGMLVFHYNAIELHEERLVCGETDLKKRLMEALEQKFAEQYLAMEYTCNLKLGEISSKYDEKDMISDTFGRNYAGMHCIFQLEKTAIRYRNIFGLDMGEPCWRMMVKYQNIYHMDSQVYIGYVRKLVQKMINDMVGKEDVYERYHSL